MTQRPLILDNSQDPWEIIDTPWGPLEAWRASTMATGTMGALSSVYDLVRADAASQAARADEAEARNTLIEHLCAKVEEFERRFEDHVARLAEAEDKRRTDEARQAALDEEPLELPPDISEYQALSPPAKIEDDTQPPSGDLHALPPKEDPGETPGGEDNVGDLPKELEDPPDPVPEPRGSVYPQPTAISLNEE